MKHIRFIFILPALLFLAVPAIAQHPEQPDSTATDTDLVQVAYRKVARKDLLGGVSVVDMEALTGKNYNTYSLDNLQGYVGGWNGNSLWGMDGDNAGYLVLVDGVPRAANNVMPTEIAQITLLKGAQAVVLYGSRAAKGAILITTKRSRTDGIEVIARANTGFGVAKAYPEYLSSVEYMGLYNEACLNDGLSAVYSPTDLYNYARGTNPYRYPNVDFYDSEYIRKVYNRSDVTAEISGGGTRAHFYANLSYNKSNDVFKFGEAKKNGNDRFSMRGNVDVDINDNISVAINANATFYNAKSAKGDYWEAASTMRPNRISPLIPLSYIDPNATNALELVSGSNNLIGGCFLNGDAVDLTNIFADYYAAGSNKYTSRQFQFDTSLNIDLGRTLAGLSFQAKFAVDYATSYNTAYDNTYAVYTPTWSNYGGTDVIVGLKEENSDSSPGTQNVSGSSDNQTYLFSGQFNYHPTIGQDHHLKAMLIAAGYQQTYSTQYHRTSNVNLAAQVDYDWRNRYYAQLGAAVIHSAKLAPGHRNAVSPALTLGWRLSNESFLMNSSVVDDLLLSVSGSVLHQDIDITDYYMYQGNWHGAGWWSFHDGSGDSFYTSQRGSNTGLTFIKRKELSVNLRTALWKNRITADASFFVNSTEGRIIEASNLYPNFMLIGYPASSFVPNMNYDNNRRVGFDFSVNYNQKWNEVDFTLGLNGTYYETKATKRSEFNDYTYQNRQGRPLDGIWGLQCAGIFQSDDEVAGWADQKFGGTVQAGDLKYVDQNGDQVIDDKDMVYLGKGGWYGAPLTLGLNLTARWKGFTFFALATGNFGAHGMKDSSYYWVYGDRKYSAVVRDRWTPETAATATYPRLTTESGNNNFRASDFWMYKTDRIDLAKVQVTYDVSRHLSKTSFVKDLSVYISGSDLLTISGERRHLETSVGTAPQYRFYNIGAKIAF